MMRYPHEGETVVVLDAETVRLWRGLTDDLQPYGVIASPPWSVFKPADVAYWTQDGRVSVLPNHADDPSWRQLFILAPDMPGVIRDHDSGDEG